MAGTINKIIVHCSASAFGNAALIRAWHTDPPPGGNGWRDIGYHWVIGNGRPRGSRHYDPAADGLPEPGRDETRMGAHCRGQNAGSIGVCLIGEGSFTARQHQALERLLRDIQARHGIPDAMIFGHADFDRNKPYCPGFDVQEWLNSRRGGA